MGSLINLAQEREKRVVKITINDNEIDFEEFKDFLEALEPDDYEMRVDALVLSINYWSKDKNAYYYGVKTVLETAKEFYEFLKDG